MPELETRCLDAFPAWLGTLAEDATALAQLLAAESLPDEARRIVAGSLNYLFKSLDLIPDGHEVLGFLDDAFVLRVAAKVAGEIQGASDADPRGVLARLAADVGLIEELLGADAARLVSYVRALSKGAARGRTAAEIASEPEVRSAFLGDLYGWTKSYTPPAFPRDEKALVTLKAFLSTRLPS